MVLQSEWVDELANSGSVSSCDKRTCLHMALQSLEEDEYLAAIQLVEELSSWVTLSAAHQQQQHIELTVFSTSYTVTDKTCIGRALMVTV